MEVLTNKYRRLLGKISGNFKRALSSQINWEARGICIEGARGTGKTTLMLQHINEHLPVDKTLYISLDDLYFRQHPLVDLAETFYQQGGQHLFMDEVHKYSDWHTAVKNIYDFYPDLQLVVSGSSILALQNSQADLSRRLLTYHLPELSFREFTELKYGHQLPAYSLDQLVRQHSSISDRVHEVLPSPLKLFREYLSLGAYPFFKEGEEEYLMRINQLINVIIDYDLPEAKTIETSTQAKLKQLLYILSRSVPFKPNIAKLARQTGTSRTRLLEMLHLLERSQLIYNLRSSAQGISLMNKPEKIYLRNTSLIEALAEGKPDKGNQRETFFLAQLSGAGYSVTYPKTGDFRVAGNTRSYLFEVGGKNKTNRQIAGQDYSFLALDDLEYGQGHTIPLWLFGFLY